MSTRFQSLLRKFKNNKEKFIMKNYSYKININSSINSLFTTATLNNCIYVLDSLESTGLQNTTNKYFNQNFLNYTENNGYLENVYNAELVNKNWILFIYVFNEIYPENPLQKIQMKVLSIDSINELSALNHCLYNSLTIDKNLIEMDWISTFETNDSIKESIINRKYHNKILHLLDDNIYSLSNINFIINETLNRFKKVNLLIVSKSNNIRTYLLYAIFSIKLLESDGTMYMVTEQKKDTRFINILLLYALIFEDIYIYNFNIEIVTSVLICKNKKKIDNEIIYKKLIHLILNQDFDENIHNIFSNKKINELNQINNMINTPSLINFDKEFIKNFDILDINTDTFL